MSAHKIVWLASYPKSGNTWVRLLLGNLIGLSDEGEEDEGFKPVMGISSSRDMFEYFTGINSYELTDDEVNWMRPAVYRRMADEFTQFGFVKAHDSFGRLPNGEPFFPADKSHGAVYIVRDPLDVAVSYSHHLGGVPYKEAVRHMNNPRKQVAGGNREQLRQVMLDWSGHYLSWTQQQDMPVCVVRYEDLKRDTVGELKRIADFAHIDEDQYVMSIEEAVEATRFDRLQEMEQSKGFGEKPINSKQFFRSGRSGEGREKLPTELQAELIAHHGEVMRALGYLKRD